MYITVYTKKLARIWGKAFFGEADCLRDRLHCYTVDGAVNY